MLRHLFEIDMPCPLPPAPTSILPINSDIESCLDAPGKTKMSTGPEANDKMPIGCLVSQNVMKHFRIIGRKESLGIDNTVIMYLTDNGPWLILAEVQLQSAGRLNHPSI